MEKINTKEIIKKIKDYIDDPSPVGRNARDHLTEDQLNLLRGYITNDKILEESLLGDATPLNNITIKFYEGIAEAQNEYTSYREAIDDYADLMAERWRYQQTDEYKRKIEDYYDSMRGEREISNILPF